MWQWLIGGLVLLVLINIGVLVRQNMQVPELGHTNGQLTPLKNKPNGVSTQSEDPGRKVEPWPFLEDLKATRQAVLAAVRQYGGADIVEESGPYIRAVFTTSGLHFHDDAEFYLDEDEKVVHFRSSSRAGYSDMGLNRKRYRELTDYYHQPQNRD